MLCRQVKRVDYIPLLHQMRRKENKTTIEGTK